MKYYRFIALLLIAGLTACGGKKEENKGEDSVEKALPSAINEVTVAKLQLVEFNHELE
jgi:hypothetical protein